MKIILLLVNLLNVYKVIWTNEIIEIPLNDNTYQYYEIPTAKLYKNGVLVENAFHYYERGVNRTSLTVVNSKHVKEFKIDYRVVFEEEGVQSEQTITFKIIDITSPEIIKVPTFIYPINSKIPTEKTLLENFHYKDNYYSNEEIVVKINYLSNININKVGVYEIEFEVMDPSYNTTKIKTTYEVYDNKYPKIDYKDIIKHNYGDVFNHFNYFKYTGNNLNIVVDESKINFNKIGTYPITIKATNESDLTTTINTSITIVDNIAPSLVLKSIIEPLEIGESINRPLLLDYILTFNDNYDKLTFEDIDIIHDININKTGKYVVKYIIKDSSNNETVKSANIEVKDFTKPTIIAKENLLFDVNSQKPYWQYYFDIYDNYDDYENLKIVIIDKQINFKKTGTYYLEIEVTDKSKNKVVKSYPVVIKDLSPPKVKQKEPIIIVDFNKLTNDEYKLYFIIEDNYNKTIDINLLVNDSKVNYNKIGQYNLIISFIDLSDNVTTINTTVNIVDIEAPELTLRNNDIIYYIDDIINPLSNNILRVEDNYDELTISDVTFTHNIQYNKVGKYKVLYSLKDSSSNETSKSLDFEVKDNTKPDIVANEELKFDIMSKKPYWLNFFNINDNYDEYEDLKIVINDKQIDFNKLGTYYIEIIVEDKSNNIRKKIFPVLIKDLSPPKVTQLTEIIVDDFLKPTNETYKSHFVIEDNYDNYINIKLQINDSEVIYNKIGKYNLTIDFEDTNGNITKLKTIITIVDKEAPVLVLKNSKAIHYTQDSKRDLLYYILKVSDNYDNIQIKDVKIDHNINYEATGKYLVIYTLEDSSNNITVKFLDFYVDKKVTPLISGNNLTLNINDRWTELEGITLSNNVEYYDVFYNEFTTKEAKTVEILYIAYDERGNNQTFQQTIYIVSDIEQEPKPFVKYLKIIILTLISTSILIILVIYNKKKQLLSFDK